MKSKKIILIKVEDGDESPTAYPMALLYLSEALKKTGYEPEVSHVLGEDKDEVDKLINRIKEVNPLLIRIFIFTGNANDISKKIAERIKKEVKKPIILEGAHPTLLPEKTLKEDCVDMVAIGKGFIPFHSLEDWDKMKGWIDELDISWNDVVT